MSRLTVLVGAALIVMGFLDIAAVGDGGDWFRPVLPVVAGVAFISLGLAWRFGRHRHRMQRYAVVAAAVTLGLAVLHRRVALSIIVTAYGVLAARSVMQSRRRRRGIREGARQ